MLQTITTTLNLRFERMPRFTWLHLLLNWAFFNAIVALVELFWSPIQNIVSFVVIPLVSLGFSLFLWDVLDFRSRLRPLRTQREEQRFRFTTATNLAAAMRSPDNLAPVMISRGSLLSQQIELLSYEWLDSFHTVAANNTLSQTEKRDSIARLYEYWQDWIPYNRDTEDRSREADERLKSMYMHFLKKVEQEAASVERNAGA